MAEPAERTPPAPVERLIAGEPAALARALSLVERGAAGAERLTRAIAPYLGRAVVVGFTGPPGAGKSTLVNAYIRMVRDSGRTVGVLAVDPTSPVSGGAILGDRLRMGEHAADPGVFIRSLAARGQAGGLTPAAVRGVDVMDAAGRAVVILETVGAGQSELDIAEIADIRVVLSAPGLGDEVQAMKAGILEIADILVVNKADKPAAEALHRGLIAARALAATGAETPILKTTATTGAGVAELAAEIDAQAQARPLDPTERRRRRARRLLAWAAQAMLAEAIAAGAGTDALADAILSGEQSPEAAARALIAGFAP